MTKIRQSSPTSRPKAKAAKKSAAQAKAKARGRSGARKVLAAPAKAAGTRKVLTLPRAGEPGPKPYNWRPIFLKALRESVGVIQPAADAASISRAMAYQERKQNPEFAEAWETAVQAGVDDLELHAMNLALGKMTKGIYFEGERVAQEAVQFERTLHKALAKHRPEWAERTELTGKGGKPLIPEAVRSFDLEAMTDEELNALRTRLDASVAAEH